ncbi:hypothetical protein SDJN03_06830, partial [Cucurbita argyrosperma subsp. sororia]
MGLARGCLSTFLRGPTANCWLIFTEEEILIPAIDFREMKFIMEFAENLVLRLMEDPKERDRKFREHVYAVKDRCQKTKEMWSYPIRPYGFWTFERHNLISEGCLVEL